jgi:hypothetical protein
MRRLLCALAALALTVASVVLTGGAASAAEGTLTSVAARAFSEIASCTADAKTLLVSVVVDESGSLRSTDPEDRRVGAILTAIDSLADLRANAGGLDVQMDLGTFAAGYEQLVGWGPVAGAHADRLRRVTRAELPEKDRGSLTDYRQALRGAQQQLDSRAAQVDPQACKVLLWFTDGALDVGSDTKRAQSELCARRGLVDGLRGDRIAVVALALFTQAGSGSVGASQREQLKALAEGEGQGATCGTAPIPSESSAGAYLPADDAGTLRRLFAGAAALIAGASEGPSAVCPDDRCQQGRVSFPVDAGVASARVVIDASGAGQQAKLVGPDGSEIQVQAGERTISSAKARISVRDGLATIDLTFPSLDGGQVGRWSVSAPSASSRNPVAVDVFYFWGVDLVLDAPAGLVIGEPSDLELRLVGQDGKAVPSALYQSLDFMVELNDAPVDIDEDEDGVFRGSVTLPTSGASSSAVVAARASVTTLPSRIQLGPVTTLRKLATSLPPSFPKIAPSRLDLPGIVGVADTTGTLRLTGSERGETKACLVANDLSGPEGAGPLRVTSKDECITVPAGKEVPWSFTVQPGGAADGRISGEVTVRLTSAGTAGELDVAVPVGFTMTRPVDQALRWTLVLSLVVLALLVPVLMLLFSNLVMGRYRLTPLTRAAAVPVTVGPTGIRRISPSATGVLIEPDDFSGLRKSAVEQTKRFSVLGVRFDRKLPKWPLGEPRSLVTAMGEEHVFTNEGDYTHYGRTAPFSFGMASSWVLVVDPESVTDTEARGRIVFINDDEGLTAVIEHRADQLQHFPGWQAMWEHIVMADNRRREATQARHAVRDAPVAVPVDADRRPAGSTSRQQAVMVDEPPELTEDDPPLPPWGAPDHELGPPTDDYSTRSRGKRSPQPRPSSDDDPPPPPNY